MEFQTLTVYHYGDDSKEDRRITIGPMNVAVVAAATEDVTAQGRSLRGVTVMFLDGASLDLRINHADLEKLEMAIGGYSLE